MELFFIRKSSRSAVFLANSRDASLLSMSGVQEEISSILRITEGSNMVSERFDGCVTAGLRISGVWLSS